MRDNKSKYEPKTTKLIEDIDLREDVRVAAGCRCEMCGVPDDRDGVRMHIHHIDCNHENNNPENLSYICAFCHPVIHKAVAGKAMYENGINLLHLLEEKNPPLFERFGKPILKKAETPLNFSYGKKEHRMIERLGWLDRKNE